MKKIITFSGFGQVYNSLENIAPTAEHIAYKKYQDIGKLFSDIKGKECDILVGWSLGGQIAIRALQAGVLKPKLLVLLATPFQFVRSKQIKCGIDRDNFNLFESDFKKDTSKALQRFSLMVARNDIKFREVADLLKADSDDAEKWLYWLSELEKFSCSNVDFSAFPKTVIIHGRNDTIVDASQSSLFLPLIKNVNIEMFNKCGHAPHLHDEAKVKEIINNSL